MLDHCSISHKGGMVLWSRAFTPSAAQIASSSSSPVNSLVRDVLIEGRTSSDEKFDKDGYAIRWTFVNDLEIIFVVAYQRILQLTYIDDLLSSLRTLFLELFRPFLQSFVQSLSTLSSGMPTPVVLDFSKAFEGWDKIFDKLLKGLEDKAAAERKSRIRPNARLEMPPPSIEVTEDSTTPTHEGHSTNDEQEISRKAQILRNRMRGRGPTRRGGRPGSTNGRESLPGSDSDTASTRKKSTKTKTLRKWGDEAPSESDMASLDYSASTPQTEKDNDQLVGALIDQASLGTRSANGLYELKDWELSSSSTGNTKGGEQGGAMGTLGSMFARLTGGKTLTEEDLKGSLAAMKEHLMKQNVAREIAEKICEGVGDGLVGKKVGSFQTVNGMVKQALSLSITRILTPKTSTDILLSIRSKLSSPHRTPYSITFVGVNGVGKSTNLSKVCFWLIQNGMRVLIAACDTFRSGAVEQLRVHVRNLGMLNVNGAGGQGKGGVELFERGYGKDAAGIAKEAIAYAKDNEFDVVLIDTAGRMQDNEPLMRALAKLVSVNNPDLILFVGEALVGNEAVDQLTKFDRALRDFSSSSGKGRGIDGMLVTKWDTVDDKVGAALSMTYVTGQPIVFVGTGQTYTDLRQLRVANVVELLLDK